MSSIKPKEKKCAGTTSQTKGLGCGDLTYHRVYGLCKKKCYPKWLTETELGQIKLQKSILKVQKPRLELEQRQTQETEEKRLKASKINTRMQVHAYIRKRDEGKPCISCGCNWNISFEAGHFFKAETFETLKYHLDNIHGQCFRCNRFVEDGNHQEYSLRLPSRIGQERFNELVRLASIDKQFSKVWDLDSLKEIRKEVSELSKSIH